MIRSRDNPKAKGSRQKKPEKDSKGTGSTQKKALPPLTTDFLKEFGSFKAWKQLWDSDCEKHGASAVAPDKLKKFLLAHIKIDMYGRFYTDTIHGSIDDIFQALEQRCSELVPTITAKKAEETESTKDASATSEPQPADDSDDSDDDSEPALDLIGSNGDVSDFDDDDDDDEDEYDYDEDSLDYDFDDSSSDFTENDDEEYAVPVGTELFSLKGLDLLCCGTTIRGLLAPSSLVTMMSTYQFNKLVDKPPLQKTNEVYMSRFSSKPFKIIGKCLMHFTVERHERTRVVTCMSANTWCYIVDDLKTELVLGIDSLDALQIDFEKGKFGTCNDYAVKFKKVITTSIAFTEVFRAR